MPPAGGELQIEIFDYDEGELKLKPMDVCTTSDGFYTNTLMVYSGLR